jgi:hypothetical protein
MAVDFCWVFVEELLPWKNEVSLDIFMEKTDLGYGCSSHLQEFGLQRMGM